MNKLEKIEKEEESRSQGGTSSHREKTPDTGAKRSGGGSHLRRLARGSVVSSVMDRHEMSKSARSFRTLAMLSQGDRTPDAARDGNLEKIRLRILREDNEREELNK